MGPRPLWCLLALVGLTACGQLFPRRAEPGGRAVKTDGARRLDRSVVPQRYTLDLRVDPNGATYAGSARVAVKVVGQPKAVRLHAQGLTIESAHAEQGGQTWPAQSTVGDDGGLTLRFDAALAAGDATLVFQFHRALLRTPGGVWRKKLDDRWYAFTRFQPDRARQAFPCFDQPEFKTPFEVSITAPQGHVVVANAPRASSEPDGQGRVKHLFKPTKPLPTYLVGFAVGPFDVVRSDGEGEVALRMITARGRRPLAGYALERAEELLGWMTDWFGRPYPFQKLDLLAIPDASVGAVENAGLITARETLLLLDANSAAPRARLWAQLVLAHELAHAWMGNLVTPRWWNDLWLNEAFATWLAAKAVAAVDPELEADLEAIGRTHWVMAIDSREGAPPVRRALPDGAGVERAFDRVTYSKGAAVLRMAEAWLGEPTLQKGVQAWLQRFAYGNATTADLFEALDGAAARPVGPTLQPFLDQPGVPLVRAELQCPKGQPPFVRLERARYRPQGAEGADDAPWAVPVCVRVGRGDATTRTCALLDGPRRDVTLEGACPDWIHPNADQAGYYRWTLAQQALIALVRDHRARLTPAERIGLAGQLEAQLEAGLLPVDVYLTALTAVAEDEHRIVVDHLVAALARLDRIAVATDQQAHFAALVRRLLTPHLERLADADDPEAPVDATLLRPKLEDALIWLGDDEGLTARAEALADRFLADPEAVEPEDLVRALPVAARQGDAGRWEALVGALGKEPDPVTRAALVTALGAFDDPSLLERSLGLILDGTLRADEHRAVTRGIAKPAARAAAWRWLELHYAALEERLGPDAAASLVTLAAGFCEPARQADVADFFAQRRRSPAVARDVDLVLQSVDRCARLRAALQPPLSAWLDAQARP